MTATRDFFAHGVAAGILLALAAEAGNWLISRASSGATAFVQVAMTLQAVVGIVGASAIAIYRARARRRPDAA